jgi:hypothetical protein
VVNQDHCGVVDVEGLHTASPLARVYVALIG